MERVFNYIEDRFGIPRGVFNGYKFFIRDDDLWVASPDIPEDIKCINRYGLRFARGISKNIKITTVALQIFGKFARRNVYNIPENLLKIYLSGKDLNVGEVKGIETGQVIVKFGDDVIGSGLYNGNTIKNQIPKARRIV